MQPSARWLTATIVAIVIARGPHASAQPAPSEGQPQEDFRGLTPAEAEALDRRIKQTVREVGVVGSASVIELHGQVQGEAVVVSAVPHGGLVREGDLLVALDDSALRQDLLRQRKAVEEARAGVETAQAEVESGIGRTREELPVAELRLRVAELARSRYLDKGGELEIELASLDRDIALAERRLKAAEQADAPARPVPLARAKAQAELDAALAAKELLARHVRPHQTAVL